MEADALCGATLAEARMRSLPTFTELAIPPNWGLAYLIDADGRVYRRDRAA